MQIVNMQGKIDHNTITVRDTSISLSTLDRSYKQKLIRKK